MPILSAVPCGRRAVVPRRGPTLDIRARRGVRPHDVVTHRFIDPRTG